MAYYNSINNLKNLKIKILTLQATEQEIVNFIQEINQISNFNHIESNLYILEIYLILKEMDKFIPLVDLSLNALPIKIILSDIDNVLEQCSQNIACDCEKNLKKEKEACCDDARRSVQPLPLDFSEPNESILTFRNKLIAKWSPFHRSENPTLKYPVPGETTNVYFVDEEIVPGKAYRSNVEIDSDGNILRFLSGPTELVQENDYEEIYSKLIGSLFDYQQ